MTKLLRHYSDLGIDARTKVAVLSDGLTVITAKTLQDRFGHLIPMQFGIGTNLTNDFPKHRALQIVMKMTECNGMPVAKISDSAGKTMCHNAYYLNYLKEVIKKIKQ